MTTGRINQVLQTLAVILGRVLGLVTRGHGDMAWALVSGATFRRFDSSPAPRRADVLETGNIG